MEGTCAKVQDLLVHAHRTRGASYTDSVRSPAPWRRKRTKTGACDLLPCTKPRPQPYGRQLEATLARGASWTKCRARSDHPLSRKAIESPRQHTLVRERSLLLVAALGGNHLELLHVGGQEGDQGSDLVLRRIPCDHGGLGQ